MSIRNFAWEFDSLGRKQLHALCSNKKRRHQVIVCTTEQDLNASSGSLWENWFRAPNSFISSFSDSVCFICWIALILFKSGLILFRVNRCPKNLTAAKKKFVLLGAASSLYFLNFSWTLRNRSKIWFLVPAWINMSSKYEIFPFFWLAGRKDLSLRG